MTEDHPGNLNAMSPRVNQLVVGTTKPVFLVPLILAAVLGRSWTAIHHLPPDPGLGFQVAAREGSVLQIFSLADGYFQLVPRLASELLALVPLGQLTYWSTLFNALIVATCALIVGWCAEAFAGRTIGLLMSLATAITYASSEGLVGNVWSVRWTLLSATCALTVTPQVLHRCHWASMALILMTGLSHAYIVVPASFFIVRQILTRQTRKGDWSITAVLLGTSLIQIAGFLSTNSPVQKYGAQTIYVPWANMGVFWYAVFLGPISLSVAALAIGLLASKSDDSRRLDVLLVGCSSATLAVLSYLQLGIKSSPAVATSVLGLFALLVSASNPMLKSQVRLGTKSLALLGSAVFLVLSLESYLASDYLTSGPKWMSEVALRKSECSRGDVSEVALLYLKRGDLEASETLACATIQDWDAWFWQR